MSWCPICGSEYREGFERCAECKVELVQSLDGIVIHEKNRQDFIKVEKPLLDIRTRETIAIFKFLYRCIKKVKCKK